MPTDPRHWTISGRALSPRTAARGGAVARHVRIGTPLFSPSLFGVYVGTTLTAGLCSRLPRLRVLLMGETA